MSDTPKPPKVWRAAQRQIGFVEHSAIETTDRKTTVGLKAWPAHKRVIR